jgi:hypothetical protein
MEQSEVLMRLRLSLVYFLIIISTTLSAQTLTNRVLEKDEVIQGTSFKKGTVVYQDEKKYLHKAVLAENQALCDRVLGNLFPYVFPKGSTVIFKESINIFGKPELNPHLPEKIIVSRKMKIYDVPVAANSEVIVSGGSITIGDTTQYLAEVTIILLEDITIKGTQVKKGDYIKIESKDKIQVSRNGEWVEL